MKFPLLAAALLIHTIDAQLVGSTCTANPQKYRTRREWRTLSKPERTAFILAYRKLYSHPLDAGPTGYKASFVDTLSTLHMQQTKFIHSTPQFLPWHRYFVYTVETELQKYSPSAVMPYWDWSYDSQAPELAPIWGSGMDAFGTQGVAAADYCVKDGGFATVDLGVPSTDDDTEQAGGNEMDRPRLRMTFKAAPPPTKKWKCLKRQWNSDGTISALSSVDVMHALIARSTTYNSFRTGLEYVPHAQVHVAISGDMGRTWSPNDPIFFLHHAFVDKLWADWQKVQPNRMTAYDGEAVIDGRRLPATLNDELAGYPGVTVANVMDTTSLCYVYADLVLPQSDSVPPSPRSKPLGREDSLNAHKDDNGGTLSESGKKRAKFELKVSYQVQARPLVETTDRADLMNLRRAISIPKEWLTMNNIPIGEARLIEQQHQSMVDKLNALDGYVSPCAFWNRNDLVAALAAKGQSLYCSVGNTQIHINCEQSSGSSQDKISRALDIKSTVRDSLPTKVQKCPQEFKQDLERIIGQPVMDSQCASNPFGSRHVADVAFGRN